MPILRRLLFAALVFFGYAQAQSPSGGVYVITKQAIAGGGDRSSGGQYELVSIVGQPSTGVTSGGSYRLQSGFQTSPINQPELLFSNGFEN